MCILKFISRERESLNRSIFHASPCDNIKKSNIFLIAAPRLYSVAVVLWIKFINKLSSCKLLQRELLRCSRKQRPNIVRLVHEYKLSVLIAFFKESVWEIWSINTLNCVLMKPGRIDRFKFPLTWLAILALESNKIYKSHLTL